MDGDIFNVRILPPADGTKPSVKVAKSESGEVPEGAVVSEMAGLVLSLDVKPGDSVRKGDPLAMIEAMKMRRPIHSPRSGTVKEVLAREGEIVDAGAVLMVIH
mgnify:CR=1 FL=1